jgi:uncharacterized protein YecT (DUF1311 family)
VFSRLAAFVLALALLQQRVACGEAHFKRFPATVTSDGAYVLAWGLKDDPAGDVASKTEIPADGPEKIDLGESETADSVEDYLVDTATGKVVATIPEFTYYAGSEGRENHFNLEVGWSPDNRGGIAIYMARYATDTIAWINPTDHKTSNVWPQIEKAIRQAAIEKKGKSASDYEISVSNPVFVRPRRLVLGVMVGALSSKREDAENYSFDIVFNVKGSLDTPQLEFASAKWASNDSEEESNADGEDEEVELNRVYHKLANALSPGDRESLKQEQLKWLGTRERMTAAEKDEKEFNQLELTRRRIVELKTRARYR